MKLRVWHNCQVGAVGNFYFYIEVESIEQAWKILNTLWDYDLFQYENNIKPDYCNASGLEYFDDEEQEWCEWYDDDGNDIMEHFEELEESEEQKMSKALDMARELVKQLEEEKGSRVRLSELNPGDVFKIGTHDFIVLRHYGNATKVISKNFMAEDVVFDENTPDYNNSNLKKIIETEIQPVIENAVGKDNIIKEDIVVKTVDNQDRFDLIESKVRVATFEEARQYNDFIVNKDLDDWWWTCTPWSTDDRGWKYQMAVVAPAGNIYGRACSYFYGVRPVCILKSNIFVSKGE